MKQHKSKWQLFSIALLVMITSCVSDDEGQTHSPDRQHTETKSDDDKATSTSQPKEEQTKTIEPEIPQKPQPRPGIIPTQPVNLNEAPKHDGGIKDPLPLEVQGMIFNRVIVKLTDTDQLTKDALIAAAEKKTGAKVKRALGGPVNTVLLEFEPTVPARDKQAQDALVHQLKTMDGIVYAEPDRMMQAR